MNAPYPGGPLYVPSHPSGITYGGACTHVAPDSCPVCDGTVDELRWRPGDDAHEVVPEWLRAREMTLEAGPEPRERKEVA